VDQPSLDGCYVKIARANKHRNELDRRIRELLDSIKEAVVTETTYDTDAGQFVVWIRHAPPVPDELSAVAGDALHNLRSALDHLIYQVVWSLTGKPWEDGQFPIAGAPDRFTKRDRETFDKLGDELTAIVMGHQPLDDVADLALAVEGDELGLVTARIDNNRLRFLRDLSNADKHRLLLPGFVRGEDTGFTLRNPINCRPKISRYSDSIALKPDTNIAFIPANTRHPDPYVQVDFDFRPSIGIGGGGDVVEALDMIRAKVQRIIGDFRPYVV